MILKYVIVKNLGAILFPESISHSQIANSFTQEPNVAESAGFALIEGGKCLSAYGGAKSCELLSFLGDEYVIQDALNPASLMKYYGQSTEEIRNRGLEIYKDLRLKLIIEVPENWDDKDVIEFKKIWEKFQKNPDNKLKLTLVDVFGKKENGTQND